MIKKQQDTSQNRQYTKTLVKTRKHIARSLQTFVSQYDIIMIDTPDSMLEGINLDKDGIAFAFYNYGDENYNNYGKIIYDRETALRRQKDYNIVLEEIENLIGSFHINYIEYLKTILLSSVENNTIKQNEWTTTFFEILEDDKDKIEHDFKKFYNGKDDLTLDYEPIRFNQQVKRIRTQLRNRINFREFNFYKSTSSKNFKPGYMSQYDITKIKLKHARKYYWLFDEGFIEELLQIKLQKEREDTNRILEQSDLEIYSAMHNRFREVTILETDDPLYLDAVNQLKYITFDDEFNYYKDNPYEHYNYSTPKSALWDDPEAIAYIQKYNQENSGLAKILDRLEDNATYSANEYHPINERDAHDMSNKQEFRNNELDPKDQMNELYNRLLIQIDGPEEDNPYYKVKKTIMEYETLVTEGIFTKTGRVRKKAPFSINYENTIKEQISEYYFRKDFAKQKDKDKETNQNLSLRMSKNKIAKLKQEYLKQHHVQRLIYDKTDETFQMYIKIWMLQFKVVENTFLRSVKHFDYKTLQYHQLAFELEGEDILDQKELLPSEPEKQEEETPQRVEPIVFINTDGDDPF